MTEVFSALSGLVSAAVRKDWLSAVTSLITLVQAVIKNLPATTQETGEFGEIITKEHPQINVRNSYSYARKNCRHCNGRGYERYDSAYYNKQTFNEELGTYILDDRAVVNPRILLCDCALRNLQRIEDAKGTR